MNFLSIYIIEIIASLYQLVIFKYIIIYNMLIILKDKIILFKNCPYINKKLKLEEWIGNAATQKNINKKI